MGFVRPSATAAGLLVGLAAVAVSVPGLQVAAGEGSLGADVRVSLQVPGELALEGDSLVVNARRLVPGTAHDHASGSATLTNQTGMPLSVHVATLPSSPQLADQLMIELRSGNRRFARGTITQLRRGDRRFVIPRGQRRRLQVRAWLPPTVRDGYKGLLQDVALELRATAKGPDS
jgi:hypothetical protein